jgi:hypothetical protein
VGVTSFRKMLPPVRNMRIVRPCSGPVKHHPGHLSGPEYCSSLTGEPISGHGKVAGRRAWWREITGDGHSHAMTQQARSQGHALAQARLGTSARRT